MKNVSKMVGGCCGKRLWSGVLAALALLLVALGTATTHAEEWVSLENGQKIQAGFMGMWQDNVVLRMSDGRRVVVPKAKLAAVSRQQADELAARLSERRKERLAELAVSAQGVTARVAPVAGYEALPQSVDLKAYVEAASKQLEAGHLRVLWDALPANHQNDVKELGRLYSESSFKDQTIVAQRLMVQLGRTMLKQRDFLFNYPGLNELSAEDKAMAEKVYTPLANILAIVGNPQSLSLDAMRNGEWEPMIGRLNDELAPHVAQLMRQLPVEGNPLAGMTSINPNSIEMAGDDRGTISVTTADGQLESRNFVLVDGRWLPDGLANSWAEMMTSAKSQLAKPSAEIGQALGLLPTVTTFAGAVLANIENAETQQEFNDTLDMYVEMVMQQVAGQMMAGNQGLGGPGMGGPGMGGPGMGGPGMSGPGMVGPGMGAPGMSGPGMVGPGMTPPGRGAAGMGGPGAAGHSGGGPGMAGHDGGAAGQGGQR